MKIKPFIFSTIPFCLSLFCQSLFGIDAAIAETEDVPMVENAEQVQVALQLDHALVQNEQAANTQQDMQPKTEVRVKLRMSKSINNFDVLNDQPTVPEIDPLTFKKVADEEKEILSNGGIIIEGDRLEEIFSHNLTVFGNGSLKSNGLLISGDRIEYDELSYELFSSNHTRVKNKDMLTEGTKLRLNIDDSTGEMLQPHFTIYNGFITAAPDRVLMTSGVLGQASTVSIKKESNSANQKNGPDTSDEKPANSRGDADILYFEGETKRRLVNSRYTTCDPESDDWYINSKELEINTESKVGVAKNATIDFKNVPILYVPYMSFPFDNQRKSGFINPTMGSTSSSGFEMDFPIYWNISPNMDATETNRYLSKRGIQLQGEFRYLLDSKSYGIEQVQYLPSDQMTHKDRYFIGLSNKQDFGNGLSASVNFNKVSDNQYFSDLSTQILVTSQVNLPQQASINYSKYGWNFSTLVEKFQNLDQSSYAYQRLPQISLSRSDQFDWGKTTITNQYTEFKTDPLATNQAVQSGSRLNSQGSLSYPMNAPYGYITPKIGFNYASYNLSEVSQNLAIQQYSSELDKSSSRTIPLLSLDSSLFFEKDLKVDNDNYVQTLEPRIFYVYVPYVDQSKMPNFDSGVADLNMGTLFTENQYVGNDRVNNANQISTAVTSRLIDQDGVQRLSMTLGERFYFEKQRVWLPGEIQRNGDRSDILVTATALLKNNWNVNSALDYSTDSGDLIKANIGTRYNPAPGKNLNLSYRYTKDTLDQIVGSGQWAIGHGYYALANLNYSILDGKAIEMVTGIEYDAGCWQSRFVIQRVQTAAAQANYAFFYQLVLGGMTSIGTSPIDLLHRTITGYRNSSMLPDNYRQEYNE